MKGRNRIMKENETKLILHALQEDGFSSDVTSLILVDKNKIVTGNLVTKSAGIISGVDVMLQTFKLASPKIQVTIHKQNGTYVQRGSVIATISGPLRDILKAKQVAINFLERLSGIATNTNQYVMELVGTSCQILDTRDTTPNLRVFERRAVLHGGGTNHNFSLDDCISITKAHIYAFGGVSEALSQIDRKNSSNLIVEVEVETKEDFLEAVNSNCDLIILNDMKDELLKEILSLNNNKKSIAVKGNISYRRVRSIASLGVDYLIIDNLAHSYKAIDIDMKFYRGL